MNLPPSIATYITSHLDNTSPTRMEGWCTPEKADAIARAVLTHRPATAIEIGVYAGRSLFAIALAMASVDLQDSNAALGSPSRILGIDPWSPHASIAGFESDPANRDWWQRLDHSAIHSQCVAVQRELGLTNVHLFRGTAQAALPFAQFALGTPPALDFLHIDGNHSEASALADVEGYVPLVRAGGVVVFDDLDWSTTKLAQARLLQLCTLDTMVGNCGFYRRTQ